MRENSTHAAEQTVGHVPDTLGEVLIQALADGNINVSAKITGQSRSAQWGQVTGAVTFGILRYTFIRKAAVLPSNYFLYFDLN